MARSRIALLGRGFADTGREDAALLDRLEQRPRLRLRLEESPDAEPLVIDEVGHPAKR
jgi:hypothetical protein